MKYSFAIAALVAAVSAQSLGDVPKCAIPCLDDAIASKTKCDKTDLACVCKDFDSVRSAATSCVIEKCGSDVAINEVLPATEKLCDNPEAGSGDSDTTKVETSTKVVVTTSAKVVETTAAAETTEAAEETTSVPPVVESTTKVVPPVINTPAPTPTSEEGGAGGSTPAPTNVGENSAAGVKGLGAIAMVAIAALAL
ncbi:hypothetical protein NW762_006619 [Fusarium torreyae]|uniref:CFEM domain-containing protein n=1 Tax=Fusarium torreyae TaxID=1237075 RepID=A0A9W8S0T2_9HYPO|nr:hypothetical protein NW762_006619 [Fusarium torreyae]